MVDISVVIPVYNGAKSIEALVETVISELSEKQIEIILVNDGSKDNSANVCQSISSRFKEVIFINLRKNFGEFNAVMCGLNHVSGRFAVLIDDDFQNPPSEILKLYNKAILDDYDVVYSYYEEKKHHWFRNFGSSAINLLNTYLLRKPADLYLSSFKLIRKEVIDEIIKSKTPHPYIDGLIFQVTNHIGKQQVTHTARLEGKSNYSTRKLISLSLSIIFGYSMLPLRLTFLLGFISVLFSLVYMLLYGLNIVSHWGSPVVIFMCGIILCCFALIGEYVGNTFLIASGKPQFVIKSISKKNS